MRVKRQASGQTLPLFAVMVPGMLALMALGLDGAQMFLERREAQGAADLAALAGVKHLPSNAALAETDAIANAALNGFVITADDVVTPYAGHANRIEVTIHTSVETFFMSILNWFGTGSYDEVDVSARAVAQAEPRANSEGDHVLFALRPCGSPQDFLAIEWPGNDNVIEGSVHSDSGITISGNRNEIKPQAGETDSEFSVTCVAKNGSPSHLRITDKYPYNEGGDNPKLKPNGDSVPLDCTGTEPPGTVCRKEVPTPDIPFYNETTKTVDSAGIDAACTTKWIGDKDVSPSTITAPGVYCALNGKMVIKAGTYTNAVTLFAQEFVVDGGVKLLTPYLDDILMYATTSTEGKGIVYSGNNGEFGSPSSPGLLISPRASSMVSFAGQGNKVYGALVGYYVKFNGNFSTLVGSFGNTEGGPPTVALIE